MIDPTPFTLQGYRALVCGLLDRGYELRSFHDVVAERRHLVLRHDVDQSIAIAREMADAEAARGWHAAYFVLMRSGMYNPFARDNAIHLKAMVAAGHELGLHFDNEFYASPADRDRGLALECRMLEDLSGLPVRIVSFHRPAMELLRNDRPVAGRLHTYMSRFIEDMGYCSDSRGEWKHGHPWNHGALQQGGALQLLTHPIWWVGLPGRSPGQRLMDYMENRTRELSRELTDNNTVWRVFKQKLAGAGAEKETH